jgi:hypothetical protein
MHDRRSLLVDLRNHLNIEHYKLTPLPDISDSWKQAVLLSWFKY